jgi:midasin (ATPase involved in ribosome maturation)
MDIETAVDRHFDFLQQKQDAAHDAFEDRADEIYFDLWERCKDVKEAAKLVDSYCQDPYETLAIILHEAAKLGRKGAIPEGNRGLLISQLMSKLTGVLSDAADDMAEDEA